MERLFHRSNSERVPPVGYDAIADASYGISHYLMTYYNWQ